MADRDLWAVLCVVAVAVAVVLTVVCDWEWGQGGMKAELAVGAWWSTAIEESWVVVVTCFTECPGDLAGCTGRCCERPHARWCKNV